MPERVEITGGCHCGQVKFTALVDSPAKTLLCNCSICAACGYEHLIVPKEDFTLQDGKDNLGDYRFGTGVARHYFCKTCGIKSFYLPRSHPDAYSINVNCINNKADLTITQEVFDGQNWEKSRSNLKD